MIIYLLVIVVSNPFYCYIPPFNNTSELNAETLQVGSPEEAAWIMYQKYRHNTGCEPDNYQPTLYKITIKNDKATIKSITIPTLTFSGKNS